jgi:hypothetical protein
MYIFCVDEVREIEGRKHRRSWILIDTLQREEIETQKSKKAETKYTWKVLSKKIERS